MSLDINTIPAAVGELTRDYLYMFFVETLPLGLVNAAQYSNFQSQIDLYNQKAIFPPTKTALIQLKWAGQFIQFSGVDESSKTTDLVFMDDEANKVFDMFSAIKELTGAEATHVAATSLSQNFNVGIAQVSVDKETIVRYRRLINTKVVGVSLADASKDGTGLGKVTVSIGWDRAQTDSSKKGKKL